MQKQPTFPNADAYVASLDGWRRECVERLRACVLAKGTLQEAVKWGHLLYAANGPGPLIRAEPQRVLFGFWRGQRLQDIEPALKASGQDEMATLEIREGMTVNASTARRLAPGARSMTHWEIRGSLQEPTRPPSKREDERPWHARASTHWRRVWKGAQTAITHGVSLQSGTCPGVVHE